MRGQVHRKGCWLIAFGWHFTALRDQRVLARETGPVGPYAKLNAARLGRWRFTLDREDADWPQRVASVEQRHA